MSPEPWIRTGADLALEAEHLRHSMRDRPSSDVATGALMVLDGRDELAAFAELQRVAEQENLLLPDLAAALVRLVGRTVTVDGPSVPGAELSEPSETVSRDDPRAHEVALQTWGSRLSGVPATAPAPTAVRLGTRPLRALPVGASRLVGAAEHTVGLLSPRALVTLSGTLLPPWGRPGS
ncbi:ANTAR domain-containing protein [Rhodococcus sp. X156]|uniref:ANTAR domain-containing protein n=1 Tax=Rhodococcus sp. X156 TaxID=2499145 RepID=UPI000FDB939E|nr:ANTAR domain-containing protein [Rhodococcus sp. X156]